MESPFQERILARPQRRVARAVLGLLLILRVTRVVRIEGGSDAPCLLAVIDSRPLPSSGTCRPPRTARPSFKRGTLFGFTAVLGRRTKSNSGSASPPGARCVAPGRLPLDAAAQVAGRMRHRVEEPEAHADTTVPARGVVPGRD